MYNYNRTAIPVVLFIFKDNKMINKTAIMGTGIQIDNTGHKIWINVDGVCILRVTTPRIEIKDMRKDENEYKGIEENITG